MVHGFKKCEIFEFKNVAMENYNTDVNNLFTGEINKGLHVEVHKIYKDYSFR